MDRARKALLAATVLVSLGCGDEGAKPRHHGARCGASPSAHEGKPLPVDVRRAAPDLERRKSTERLEVFVRKGSELTDGDVEAFAEATCGALTFDVEILGVDPDDRKMAAPVRLVVLEHDDYVAATDAPGTYGVAFGAYDGDGDAMVLPTGALKNRIDLDDTLAHEITHLVQGRFAPYDLRIAWYFVEGHAIDVGSLYGMRENGEPTSFVPPYLDASDGGDAELTFHRYGLVDETKNIDQLGHDQAISGFFVEYLRVEHGLSDVSARLLRLMEHISDGESPADAFTKTMGGLSLSETKDAFVRFMDRTATDLDARYAGTVFE